MPLHRCSAASLANYAPGDPRLGEMLAKQYRHAIGHAPSASEVESWSGSLPVLARDLQDAGLGEVEVLVEYLLQPGSKRADVVLAGKHPQTGEDSYVVVELKAWSHAKPFEADPELVTVDAPGPPRLHPVTQVRDYCEFIADFTLALDDPGRMLRGVAYLHNAEDSDVHELYDLPGDDYGQLFTRSRRGAFLDFLTSRLAPGNGRAAADRLAASQIAPSPNLIKVARDAIRERAQFVLLDEQHVAYRLVLHAVERAQRSDQKTVVVVTGGPGSGKSVIALSVLGELYRRGARALHATGSRAFTKTMRKVAGAGSKRVQKLFGFFNDFIQATPNDLDVLVCDEAHRIRETSESRFTPREKRTGRPQVDELLSAARVPVFLLDEYQVVRPGEIGTVAEIRAAAETRGFEVQQVSLDGQFRCGGSRRYEEWVRHLLGLEGDGPIPWEGDEETGFQVQVADSPWDLEGRLRTIIDEHGLNSRMTAGFCWPWSDVQSDMSLVPDVQIGDWHHPWNNKSDRKAGDAPPTHLWATEEGGFDQVGCVYTAQGFEYDYSGVILGPDLLYRDGRLVVDRRANHDPAMRKAETEEQADALVRNIYKVLLTRGMHGTMLYSTDPETQEFLRRLVRGHR
ncbi:DUF2075 domain-containing protein [Lipingzhangella sp. LS1_29]|uniref:DUF2075 domain-containing protein n=1 Tax=Lipingzhangella rawalii TaxID=2055835 RepID=A0ABU2H7C9_9ACTN|nr:DUF2075 domain-containing protein [Lipingzhangella rawalii]MDS1270750.1 DUF2075 domain-containing protein [Lipingzhangella rawalii]